MSGSRTDVHIDDDAFVRAPPSLVYHRLTDPARYGEWWPGFRLEQAVPVGGSWTAEAEREGGPPREGLVGRPREPGEAFLRFTLPAGRLRRRLRIHARPYRFREGKGVVFALSGAVDGRVEWWLEPARGGTVVHHLGWLRDGRAARHVAAYRASARRGLWGLKDVVQSEVRERAGLSP